MKIRFVMSDGVWLLSVTVRNGSCSASSLNFSFSEGVVAIGGTRVGSSLGRTMGAVSSVINSVPAGRDISGSENRRTDAEAAVVKMAAIGSPNARLPITPEALLLNVAV